jgi:hypothetical protein
VVALAVLHNVRFNGLGVWLGICWLALLVVRLALLLAICNSPPSLWARWRERCYAVLRCVEAANLLFSYRAHLVHTVATTKHGREFTWLMCFIFLGGQYINFLAVSVAYQIRFSIGFPLHVAHLAVCLGTMDWTFSDVALQHYPEYLAGRY